MIIVMIIVIVRNVYLLHLKTLIYVKLLKCV